jgi:hypothetical protein
MNSLKMIISLGLALLASHPVNASKEQKMNCTAEFNGPGYSWVLALTWNAGEKAVVSIPYGPRGGYLNQSYSLKKWSCLRNGCSHEYEKSSSPQGYVPDLYNQNLVTNFFPQLIVVHDYTWSGKARQQLEFKEQTLALECDTRSIR